MTSPSLQVVALISGGKDSFYSLLHCIAQGHSVVALANLCPPSTTCERVPGTDSSELDSFMYQTAGHAVIPLYEEALGLPLYRLPIEGAAVNTSRVYSHTASTGPQHPSGNLVDETESLIPLLQLIMAKHPEVNAVSSGAILSTYQRTRIESVASRLGLTSLSYLWNYPALYPSAPAGLLDDMRAVGLDARIIKVASGGLSESFLWKSLKEPATSRRVQLAVAKFGGSPLGEGGEYETLVLAGPKPLWRGRIVIHDSGIHEISEPGSASVAHLKFDPCRAQVVKFAEETEDTTSTADLRLPSIWDPEFESLALSATPQSQPRPFRDAEREGLLNRHAQNNFKRSESQIGEFEFWQNRTSSLSTATAFDQMKDIVLVVRDELASLGLGPETIVFTTILLESISRDFLAINTAYASLFTGPNPPARVTIATRLPQGVKVSLSLTIHRGDAYARKALHIQSRSYWAPSNIGPYSQAYAIGSSANEHITYVAGQIPLVPASMEVFIPQVAAPLIFRQQACLALQHQWRIGAEMKSGWWAAGVAYIVGPAEDIINRANTVSTIWEAAHEHSRLAHFAANEDNSSDDVDVWDQKYNKAVQNSLSNLSARPSFPDFSLLAGDASNVLAPGLVIAQVDELPRGCPVEWQGFGLNAQLSLHEVHRSDYSIFTTSASAQSQFGVAVVCLAYSHEEEGASESTLSRRLEDVNEVVRATLRPNSKDHFRCASIVFSNANISLSTGCQIIPCTRIWGKLGTQLCELEASMIVFSVPD